MARMSMPHSETLVIGGVDTHKEQHVAVALNATTGVRLGTAEFPTRPAGYAQLLNWLSGFGQLQAVGLEGASSWGAGLCRSLQAHGVVVLEVPRPQRQVRRRRGKSDPLDAEAAARAVLAGEALGTPKCQDGPVEAVRVLRVARQTALKARTQAANALRSLVDTAPAEQRQQLRDAGLATLVARARGYRRLGPPTTPEAALRWALKRLAERWAALDAEISELDAQLAGLVAHTAPQLLATHGVGVETASALLVAAGDNPQRLATEAAFAALCGVSPVDASSGQQRRHRLNRGGNRQANRALWVIVLARMRHDAATRRYVVRRTQQGLSKTEIIRCLKRYLARQLYRILLQIPLLARRPVPLDTP